VPGPTINLLGVFQRSTFEEKVLWAQRSKLNHKNKQLSQ